MTSAPPIHISADDTEDDEHTAPSSAANTHDASSRGHLHPRNDPLHNQNNPFHPNHHHHHPFHASAAGISRFLELTRKRFSSGGGGPQEDYDSDDDDLQSKALIAGYLQKLGRNGKWQTRWFETDGECLSYYRNAKRSKLLATLDLEKVRSIINKNKKDGQFPSTTIISHFLADFRLASTPRVQVGAIEIDLDDPSECSFRIQVMGRLYHLRADSRGVCRDWVITLNRVKEARLQQGNVKLIHTSFSSGGKPFDLLLDFQQQNQQPQVVVVSNRERTRAVDEVEQWDQLIRDSPDDTNDGFETLVDPYSQQRPQRMSAISTVVVARWSKRHSTIQKAGSKLSKWARSLKKYSCTEIEQEKIYLDRHVHPPGHDYNTKPSAATSKNPKQVPPGMPKSTTMNSNRNNATPLVWTGNETTSCSSSGSGSVPLPMPSSASAISTTSTTTTITTNNVLTNEERNRSLSVASDYDSRMLS
jgi:hypothetical protein